MKRRPSAMVLLAALMPLFCFASSSRWDGEYWQYLNWTQVKWGRCKLYVRAELRLNDDFSNAFYYRISENFAFNALSWLDLEAHYSYLYHKSAGTTEFVNVNRWEVEVNPFIKLKDGSTIKWRNRLEILDQQGEPKLQYIFRHRAMAIYPVNYGNLIGINISDEVFYNFDTRRFTQNRFVPLELMFKLTDRTTFNVFMMVRNWLSSNKWYRSIVLGTELSF